MVTPFTSMQTLVVTFSIDHGVILLLAYDVANVDLLKLAVMQFVVHLSLQPLNDESDEEDNISSLKRPHLCCPPTMTVHHLCKVDHNSC
jgi:hypothetical protein